MKKINPSPSLSLGEEKNINQPYDTQFHSTQRCFVGSASVPWRGGSVSQFSSN